MTPHDEIRTARESIGWSQQALADQLGTTATQVSKWERGRSRMRPVLWAWLQRLARFHEANPPPDAPVYISGLTTMEYPTTDE